MAPDRSKTRITIEIDDELLAQTMRRCGIHTKTEAVDLALRCLAGEPMTTTEALDMRGARAIDVVPPETGP